MQSAETHVRTFFKENILVRYKSLSIDRHTIINGNDSHFFSRIEHGIQKNRQAFRNILDKINAEGTQEPINWITLEQGYLTKLIHTAAHLLDGFFGVDSAFYNLVDDSRQITDRLLAVIQKTPQQYWLVAVTGDATSGSPDQVPLLRPLGKIQH